MIHTLNLTSHRLMFLKSFSSAEKLSTQSKTNQTEMIYRNENIIIISNDDDNLSEKTSTLFRDLTFFLFKYSFSRENMSNQKQKNRLHNFNEYDIFSKNPSYKNINTSSQLIIFSSNFVSSYDQVQRPQKTVREKIIAQKIIALKKSRNDENKKNMTNENDRYRIKINRIKKKLLQS